MRAAIEALPPIADDTELRMLGIAHGWAGLLYALLLWADATRGDAAGVGRANGSTSLRARRFRRGAVSPGPTPWAPIRRRAVAVVVQRFGRLHAHLWALAYRTLGDDSYATLAERAAWGAFEAPDGVADLCCGLAGRAYATLAAYKLTRDEAWLERSRELADRAAVRVRQYALRRDSLYKGEVGIAVLAADLERPLESCMPAFEAEGWATRATDPTPRHGGSERRDQP